MIILTGHKFECRDIVKRVVMNLKCARGERNMQRWVLVMHTFAVGSTVAYAMCQEFNLDPEEVIK